MIAARRAIKPAPPPRQAGPIINGSPLIRPWLTHYWQKLQLPAGELNRLAITQDRQEYTRWTGKRLNIMVLGCYCYLPAPSTPHSRKHTSMQEHPGGDTPLHAHPHLISINPHNQPNPTHPT